ncbi:Protein CYPRO4 [Vitis vinifera]|uniref:Protein CYPRO4 n=1 Tax=Vitis vinifera TaxID=29760 RepID=A0A438FMB1_VITVI|nr:Protein CYPRO4 [Vitis vinifera]
MGGSHSREGLDLSDSSDDEVEEEEEEQYDDVSDHPTSSSGTQRKTLTPTSISASLDEVDAKLKDLKLKYPSQSPDLPNAVKLYLHIGGNTPKAKWIVSEKIAFYSLVKTCKMDGADEDEDDGEGGGGSGSVWAMKFFRDGDYRSFVTRFQDCLFENVYGVKATEENKVKVYGKDFIGWLKPEVADDSMWEDAEEGPWKSPQARSTNDLMEEFEEAATNGGIQSLALGALDNSFLVGDSGRCNPKEGAFDEGGDKHASYEPLKDGKPHATGLHQLDIETGKIVTEWKLCQWDMREKRGMVQNITTASSPVLHWTQGHQFSRGTNFQCFATTGDGSIVVGSLDGKIRLYSRTSMRQAKTAFPGLGSPITHVDVTYDGKWILGTADTFLILICTSFTDKDGKTKTGFSGRMGNKIPAPRLLKLTPVDSHMAGVDNKFHGGQFSWVTENGKQERHLVATVGKFSVIWNFQQVKNSSHECYQNQQGLKSCYCYKIVLKDESIVESRFMHDKFAVSDSPEAPLVVATPLKVSSFSISNKR